MEYPTRTIKVSGRSDVVRIVAMGDLHVGTKAFNEEKLKEIVKWIKGQKNIYWFDVGDKVEAINYSDPRFDMDTLPEWLWRAPQKNSIAMLQAQYYCKLIAPIKDKCLGMSVGNHERVAHRKYHQDIHNFICTTLNVPDLGWGWIMRITFQRSSNKGHGGMVFKIAGEHGYSAGRTDGAKMNAVVRSAQRYGNDINVFVSGHSHKKLSTTIDYLTTSDKGEHLPKHHKVICMIVPSFFRTYMSGIVTYGEEKSYSLASTGVSVLNIRPFYHTTVSGRKDTSYIDYHLSE